MKARIVMTVGALAVALLLSACVTTSNAPEIKSDPKKAEETHVSAGLGYLKQGDKEAARRHFTKALGFNRNSAGAHNGMALVYQMEQNWELAEKEYLLSLREDSTFSLARNNYSVFLYGRERYQDAEEQLLQVTQDLSYNRRDQAYVNLARTQLQLGKTDAAIASFKQALSINYNQPLAHLELAQLYFDRKEYPLAKFHMDQLEKRSRATAKSLLLGIRIEKIFGNTDKLASYEMALKNMFPYSAEYLQYKQMQMQELKSR